MKVSPKLVGFVLRLIAIFGVVAILYYGKSVLLLLTVSGLIAVLLDPIDNKLRSWGWKPGFAIAGAVFVLMLFFAALFFAIGQQAASFAENWPEIEDRLTEQIEKAQAQVPMLGGGGASDSTSVAQDSTTRGGGATRGAGGSSGGSMLQNLPLGQSQITGALSSTLS
ncbi:MAG: AI-2E family transporter, partial [Lewinella sp.]